MSGEPPPHAAPTPRDEESFTLRAVAETLRGNREAFREVVLRYGPLIQRLALSYLGNREEAEEASQEIFFRAYRSLRTFRMERPFLPWLYTIALNHLRSRRSRSAQGAERFARHARDMDPGSGPDPQAAVVADEAREELRAAVSALPPTIRDPVYLHYFEGMAVASIATLLGVGTENVKSRLHRGRSILRKALDRGATG